MLFIMIRYQPGSSKEKEALLQQIGCLEACWAEDKASLALKMWKRKMERARELKLIIPDPSVLLSGLDAMTEKMIKRDQRRSFRVESAREAIKVDVVTSFEAVEKLAILLESELEELVSTLWSTAAPRVKSTRGTPEGGKDGKNPDDSKGKGGKDGKGKEKGKVEPCYFFSETEDGCNKGQQCPRYHRMLKPEGKRCYVCGSTKHMAGECDRPKREDSAGKGTPKRNKGKSDKGKSKEK